MCPVSRPAFDAQLVRRLKAEGVWTTAEALCMKREALLDCLETMQERHRLPWARTSIDIAIEVFISPGLDWASEANIWRLAAGQHEVLCEAHWSAAVDAAHAYMLQLSPRTDSAAPAAAARKAVLSIISSISTGFTFFGALQSLEDNQVPE